MKKKLGVLRKESQHRISRQDLPVKTIFLIETIIDGDKSYDVLDVTMGEIHEMILEGRIDGREKIYLAHLYEPSCCMVCEDIKTCTRRN